jgi:hypothetical protein
MPDTTFPQRIRLQRMHPLTLTALLSAVLVAGCGATTSAPTRSGSTTASSVANAIHATSPRSTAPDAGGAGPLAFARCMRANGVSNFPDPEPGHGGAFNTSGINPSAPTFKAAEAKCQKLLQIQGAPGGPTYSPQVKAQALARLRKIAVCMRAHDIADFPDPSPSRPSNQAGSGPIEITEFDGVFLVFPATINPQAPAYRQALTACGAPPLGLHH